MRKIAVQKEQKNNGLMPTLAQNCMHLKITLAMLFVFNSNNGMASEHG